MKAIVQDIRYGFRSLLKNPTFTVVAVITLALGIGAATAIITVVNAVLLRPLPYANSDRLTIVWETQVALERAPVAPANFLDWKERNQAFDYLAAYKGQNFNLTEQDDPERLRGIAVSADLFPMLGINAALGRTFTHDDDQPGTSPVVIISHGVWQRLFGSDPKILDKVVMLNGRGHAVIGVLPPGKQFPRTSEVWVPLALTPSERTVRDTHYLNVLGRLKPNVSVETAQAEMEVIAKDLESQYPASNTAIGVKVIQLQEQVVGDIRVALWVLLGAVIFVLLIACTNVANLLLARSNARQKEIAIRSALGAPKRRIIQQLLTESTLLSSIGGGIGLLLAYWGTPLLIAISPNTIPRSAEISVDLRVLGMTLLITLATGFLFGLAPAMHLSGEDFNETLKEGTQYHGTRLKHRSLRSLLVVGELAVALMLLISAGLMVKSFLRLQNVDPGFNPDNVLAMQITLPQLKYANPTQRAAFFRDAIDNVKQVPGIVSAGIITTLPPSGGSSSTSFVIEGRPAPAAIEKPLTEFRAVSPDYFSTMGIVLRQGRYFTEQDQEKSAHTIIINETLARRFFPDEDPIGKRLGLSGPIDWREIVGVVADVKDYGLDAQPRPESYIPYPQATAAYNQYNSMALVVRSLSDPLDMTTPVRQAVQKVDKSLPVYNVITMEQVLENAVAQPRLFTFLLGTFALVALTLAAVGIYGVMAYSVTQRKYEIGLRMALGAQQGDILRLIVGNGMLLTSIGIIIGLVGAFALTRVMATLLYDVSKTDSTTFIGVTLLLAVVALLACYIPARKAMKVDPSNALRFK